MRIAADSHAVVWYLLRPERLSPAARAALLEADTSGDGIVVSVVTLVDLWHATRKTSDPLPVPDYQVVRAALLDPGNILDLVPVTQQTVLRHEGIAHPS